MVATEVGRSESLLEELATWVRLETPTTDAAAVNRLMDIAEGELSRAGAAVSRIPGRNGFGDNLIARVGIARAGMAKVGAASGEKPIFVAGHLDTVWSLGTIEKMPYVVNGAKAHGPGIYDMKAGSFVAFHAVRSILQQGIATQRPIVLLLTPDEEVGSPSSRDLIEREAAQAAYALIPEPAGGGGACVTARKGVGRFTLRVEGRGSHAGSAFEDGASAVVELSRQIIDLHGMVDVERGITLNAAPIWGGSRPNVIASQAGCEIDLRVNSAEDGAMMEARILGLQAKGAGCRVIVEGGMNRPPYTESAEIKALYGKAREIADRLGLALPKQHRGGGSDGNFAAALGIPTLDGIGCPGAGAHADHEHILWDHLAQRAALMAGLLETL
jgi:glutamate carboxypeptidase